jgi:hypothetical protein
VRSVVKSVVKEDGRFIQTAANDTLVAFCPMTSLDVVKGWSVSLAELALQDIRTAVGSNGPLPCRADEADARQEAERAEAVRMDAEKAESEAWIDEDVDVEQLLCMADTISP